MKIAITIGDPAGIGPEIVLKAAAKIRNYKNLFIFGNKKIFKKTANDLGIVKNYELIKTSIIDCAGDVHFQYGRPTEKTGGVAMASINCALQYRPDIIITSPIVKYVIRSSIPDFVGHTEYLAKFFGVKIFAMVGVVKKKRIMLLTTHLPLRHIIKNIEPDRVAQKIIFFDWGLKRYFGIHDPQIAVSALNPHAFEFSLGEDEKIKKGIFIARKRKIDVQGPYPADSLFTRNFDGFLAMYHDQAMIYLKAFKGGLNFTMGLPLIRISPLHGAALDIAGKNKAESLGFLTALHEAIKIAKNVRCYERKTIH